MDLVHLDHFFVGGALTWGVSYGQGQGCDYTEKTQNPLDPATPSEVFGEIRGKFAISLVLTTHHSPSNLSSAPNRMAQIGTRTPENSPPLRDALFDKMPQGFGCESSSRLETTAIHTEY